MDTVSPSERSRIMRNVKSDGNKSTEAAFVKLLRRQKITGWRRHYSILGKPDFVFPKARVAIFIDGCFWHGCPKHCRLPSSNHEYWKRKILNNSIRDKAFTRQLKILDWRVVRIWEHELAQPASLRAKLNKIQKDVQQAPPAHPQTGC